MSEQMTSLIYDFGSFFNISDSEALSRFISAMSGSSDVLDQFGVNIRASAIEEELFRMGITKTEQQATEQEKALARFNIIRNTMARQGAIGDAEKTADSFANSWKRVKAQATDALEAIGAAVLPVVARVVALAADGFMWIASFIREHQSLVQAIGAIGLGMVGLGVSIAVVGAIIYARAVASRRQVMHVESRSKRPGYAAGLERTGAQKGAGVCPVSPPARMLRLVVRVPSSIPRLSATPYL
jgi:hypothetical protein